MKRSGFIIVNKGKHAVGLQDKDGKEILPCEYDKILDYDDDGYIRFIKDGVYGTIDLKGEIRIPLSAQLTHLGVFYEEIARAKRGDLWGLVDVDGEEVTGFDFKQINAHYNDGYIAIKCSGEKGFLTETGIFESFTPKKKGGYKPDIYAVLPFTMLSEKDFFYVLTSKIDGCWDDLHLRLYYRDTDANVDVKHLYRKGSVIRNDRFLQVSDRLMRPVHRLRFVIASPLLVSHADYAHIARQKGETISKEKFFIPPETYLLVMDVTGCGNTTQVLLLHLPDWAYPLSREYGFKLSGVKPVMPGGTRVESFAKADFQRKMSEVVHGHSLQDAWIEAMRQPVGLDDALKLNDLETKEYVCQSEMEQVLMEYWKRNYSDFKSNWETAFYLYLEKGTIQIVVGDIQKFKTDAKLEPSSSIKEIRKKSDIKKLCAEYAETLRALPELKRFSKLSIPCPHLPGPYDLRLLFAKAFLRMIISFLRKRMCQAEVFLFCEDLRLAAVYKEAGEKNSILK